MIEAEYVFFLSHNFKDKDIVEHIALKLKSIYGQNNIFYDSWSIQPGEGIIDKMNEGLNNMDYFFFFVSRNSLQSNMVKLEWQNAIYIASQNKCRFVPIKIDDCIMPSILMQNLYIDFYNNGIEVGFSQMMDVINGVNTGCLVAVIYWIYKFVTTGDPSPVPGLQPNF